MTDPLIRGWSSEIRSQTARNTPAHPKTNWGPSPTPEAHSLILPSPYAVGLSCTLPAHLSVHGLSLERQRVQPMLRRSRENYSGNHIPNTSLQVRTKYLAFSLTINKIISGVSFLLIQIIKGNILYQKKRQSHKRHKGTKTQPRVTHTPTQGRYQPQHPTPPHHTPQPTQSTNQIDWGCV